MLSQRISELLVQLMQNIKRLDERLTKSEYNPNPEHIEDLTPSHNADPDKTYSKTLLWALRNPKVKNIAMTGPYGSGKSSILKTFENDHPEYTYLNISLATFEENNANDEDDRKRIEISILQQIFYKVSSTKVPFSRFRRIRNTAKWRFIINAILLLLWVIASSFLFKPDFFNRLSWWKQYLIKNGDLVLYTATALFITGSILILIKLFKTYNSARFHKLNVSNGELELAQESDTSILNKHLDEILYFFEETHYDVVIIEDLDRFQDPEIFTKLRELNNLINSSSQINRRVTFIYALKDDIFKDNNRTKFFDLLVPVIPVINSSNSGEILLKKFKDAQMQGSLSDTYISDITLFIDDMRMLKNIYNEYVLYKSKLGLKLNEEKLLGLIVYKNFYPTDFADLHINKGLIFNSFDHKAQLIAQIKSQNESEIIQVKKEIEQLEALAIANIKELRLIYVMALLQKIPDAYRLRISSNTYTYSQLTEDTAFGLLKNQNNLQYLSISYSNYQNAGFNFKTVEKEVNPNLSFDERESSVELKVNGQIDLLKSKLDKLQEENNAVQGWSLMEFIKNRSVSVLYPDAAKEKLLTYLLRRGYIDEMYHSYISYFYEGTITRTDMDFVISIKNFSGLNFNFELIKKDQIIKKLRLSEYSQKEVLNYDFVDHLASKNKTLAKEFQAVIKQISNQESKSVEFLDGYIKQGKLVGTVFKALCKQWSKIWDFIQSVTEYGNEKKNEYLQLILIYADLQDIESINKGGQLAAYIASKQDFLNLLPKEHIQKTKDIISKLKIEFKEIDFSEDSQELFDFVYKNSHYEISEQMIETILSVKGKKNTALIQSLQKSNYTTILDSGCTPLINYINTNLDIYLAEVFLALPENSQESESTLLKLLNEEAVDEDDKKQIINKEEVIYTDFSSLPNSLWGYVLEEGKINPKWANMILYFQEEEKSDSLLTEYLNQPNHYEVLSKSKIGKTDGEDKEVIKSLDLFILNNNELSNEAYSVLIKSDPYTWSSLNFDKVSSNKVDILLNNSKLSFTKSNYDRLKTHFDGKNIVLTENNFKTYLSSEDEFIFDVSDYKLLLKSTKIELIRKVEIIKSINPEIITEKALSDQISQILIAYQHTTVDYTLFKKLVSKNSSNAIDVPLLVMHFSILDHGQIREILELMGNSFKSIAAKGSRPSITLNQANHNLTLLLEQSAFISSFKIQKDKIIINTKRK